MSKTLISFCVLLTITVDAFCQPLHTNGTDTSYGTHYCKPEFCGGEDSLRAFLLKNVRYPEAARENNIEGRVIVRFLVDEHGVLSHFALLRGIGGGCDEEALRVLKIMPKWIAASYKGRAIRTVQLLPVVFVLE